MEDLCITRQDWLRLSKDPILHSRISHDPYIIAYQVLLRHFSALKTINWDAAVVGLHMVYGWMPTIPDLNAIMHWNDVQQNRLCEVLTSVANGRALQLEDAQLLKSFSNNSIVGASKLMHFLCPTLQPIWDSRVAKIFHSRTVVHNYQVNSIKNWMIYTKTLREWETYGDVQQQCDIIRNITPHLRTASNIRTIELVLFHTQANADAAG